MSVQPEHDSSPRRRRLPSLFGVALVALLVGALLSPIAVGAAATTVNAYIKNWPAMPWRVSVVAEPAKTPITIRREWTMTAGTASHTNPSVYTVPAGKVFVVTTITFQGATLPDDGDVQIGEISTANGIKFPMPLNTREAAGLANVTSVIEDVEVRIPQNTVLTAYFWRALPRGSAADGTYCISGYLISAQ